MPTTKLEVRVRSLPGIAVLELHGEIDARAGDRLNTAYVEAEGRASHVILLNFSDVASINSVGIVLIIGLLARARKAHRRLLACGLNEYNREIFRITRLSDFIRVFPDETSALMEG